MVAVQALAGFAGIKLPFPKAGVLALIFIVSGLIKAAVRGSLGAAVIGLGWFLMFHSDTHAIDAPATDPGSYILGLAAATTLMQPVRLRFGVIANRLSGTGGMRALGVVVLAGGARVLAGD